MPKCIVSVNQVWSTSYNTCSNYIHLISISKPKTRSAQNILAINLKEASLQYFVNGLFSFWHLELMSQPVLQGAWTIERTNFYWACIQLYVFFMWFQTNPLSVRLHTARISHCLYSMVLLMLIDQTKSVNPSTMQHVVLGQVSYV